MTTSPSSPSGHPAGAAPCAQIAATQQVDLHRLELRFKDTRIVDPRAVHRLADSIEERGQLVACIAVADGDATNSLILLDGYRRVAALERLGHDTALMQCWSGPLAGALAQILANSLSRPFDPIEEALMLRELIDAMGLTQRQAAQQCARDVSWVQRRLALLSAVPQALVEAVRNKSVSCWAAQRILAPLARANSEHANQLLTHLQTQPLSTRELQVWFEHYQSAQHLQRQRMVDHPGLLLESLQERQNQRSAKDLSQGPERELAAQAEQLQVLLGRLCPRLSPLSRPLEAHLQRTLARLSASIPGLSNELARLLT